MSERSITTDDGVRLWTRSDGDPDAPALLLINSLGTDLSMWDPQIAAWSEFRRVVRFDQRGHGRSSCPPPPYTVEQFGRDALAVLDAHEVAAADICGLSLGGIVALWVAATAPERIERAVFADTAARVGTEAGWRERAATVRADGMGAITDLVLARFFSPDFLRSGHASVTALDRTLRAASVDGYTGSCEALATADLTGLATSVRAPSLVMVGGADEATPPADARALHALIPDARLIELPGAGHLANLERPERFGQVVRAFLTRQPVPDEEVVRRA
ncbi:3-oxoadipate enol-lactonase [Nitriliruptor alkaliphilus]|uniref:3-oxoadipate enol-lactonase n=1 Tax=Nitriliruptor alkaliphilus TaxID=427918 RepID=UPI0006962AF5|nr:3-oxoadipate enol-lactonase [Nitriliruptor alkaliphilus]